MGEINFAIPFSLKAPLDTLSGLKDLAAAVKMLGQAAVDTKAMFGSLERTSGDVTKYKVGGMACVSSGRSGPRSRSTWKRRRRTAFAKRVRARTAKEIPTREDSFMALDALRKRSRSYVNEAFTWANRVQHIETQRFLSGLVWSQLVRVVREKNGRRLESMPGSSVVRGEVLSLRRSSAGWRGR